MSSNKAAVLRLWSDEEVEDYLQWLESNKSKARKMKPPQFSREIKNEVERFRDNAEFSVPRITDKFYNMKKQYLGTKKSLNSTGHGVNEGTVEGRSTTNF